MPDTLESFLDGGVASDITHIWAGVGPILKFINDVIQICQLLLRPHLLPTFIFFGQMLQELQLFQIFVFFEISITRNIQSPPSCVLIRQNLANCVIVLYNKVFRIFCISVTLLVKFRFMLVRSPFGSNPKISDLIWDHSK